MQAHWYKALRFAAGAVLRKFNVTSEGIILMKKILLASVALLISHTAYAADAVIEEVPVAVEVEVFSWTGFYLGVRGGYGWTDGDFDSFAGPGVSFVSEGDLDGFLVGVYAGAQYQFDNNVVLGVEVDVDYRDGDSSAPITVLGSFTGINLDAEVNWTGSARLRAGYAMDRWLPYVTGGFAFADYDVDFPGLLPPGFDTSSGGSSVGWTLGFGTEYAFTDNWIFRAEYRYSDFGDLEPNFFVSPFGSNFETETHDVTIGVSYKF